MRTSRPTIAKIINVHGKVSTLYLSKPSHRRLMNLWCKQHSHRVTRHGDILQITALS